MREIDRGLAKSRAGLVLITPALLERVDNRGVSDKELSELLARDQLIPVVHGTTYEEVRKVSPGVEPRLLRRPVAQLVKRTALRRELQATYPG